MSLIGSFSKQTAEHRPYAGRDGYGKPSYGPARTIRVRKDPAAGVRRSETGTDVAVETEYLTEEAVALHDDVDGKTVRRVVEIHGKNGKRLGCEFAV